MGRQIFKFSMQRSKATFLIIVVGYLTPDSDLDLAPDPDQFGALPPVRYINL